MPLDDLFFVSRTRHGGISYWGSVYATHRVWVTVFGSQIGLTANNIAAVHLRCVRWCALNCNYADWLVSDRMDRRS